MATAEKTVCLQGIRHQDGSLLPEDMVKMYFENPRIGGPICDVLMDHREGCIRITFAESAGKSNLILPIQKMSVTVITLYQCV